MGEHRVGTQRGSTEKEHRGGAQSLAELCPGKGGGYLRLQENVVIPGDGRKDVEQKREIYIWFCMSWGTEL